MHLRRFTLGLFEEEIDFTGGGIAIYLVVPAGLFAHAEPADQPLIFLRREGLDCSFDLLNAIHTWSLTLGGGAGPPLGA